MEEEGRWRGERFFGDSVEIQKYIGGGCNKISDDLYF